MIPYFMFDSVGSSVIIYWSSLLPDLIIGYLRSGHLVIELTPLKRSTDNNCQHLITVLDDNVSETRLLVCFCKGFKTVYIIS